MWPKDFDINVSRESLDDLQIYHKLLLKWQPAINLVSNKTLQDSWVRHFADSAQLSNYIPYGVKTIMDWGSGAGFPGSVLAVMRPELDFMLVESDERKCQFLRTVSRETSATMRIENARIEDVVAKFEAPDLVTARALKPIVQLLDFGARYIKAGVPMCYLLLKGEAADKEIQDAQERYIFDVDRHASLTHAEACVLLLRDIKCRY